MSWAIDDVRDKPHQSCGYVGKLMPQREGVYGSIKVEGWLYGCAQNGLFGFNNLSGAKTEDFESLKEFLTHLTTDLKQNGEYYKTRRYLFILTERQIDNGSPFIKALVKASKLLDTYENLSHGGQMQHLYRLDL